MTEPTPTGEAQPVDPGSVPTDTQPGDVTASTETQQNNEAQTQEYKTGSGAVVSVENGETVVTHPDGSRTSVDGDYYDTVVALATLYPDRY